MPNRYTPRRRWLTRLESSLKFITVLFLLTFGLTAAWNTTIPTVDWQPAMSAPYVPPRVQTLVSHEGQLYAGTTGGGVFVYQQGQWQAINQGLINTNIKTLISYQGQLYTGTWGGGVFVYQQGQWQAINQGLTNTDVFVLINYEGKLYAGVPNITNDSKGNIEGGVFVYQEGQWQAINQGLTNTDVRTIVSHGKELYAGTWGGGVFRYEQKGQWQAINQGLTGDNLWTLVSYGENLYAGADKSGVFRYEQGQWQELNQGLPKIDIQTIVPTLVSYKDELYAGTWGGGVFVYRQGKWQMMNRGLTQGVIFTLISHNNLLYAGTLLDGVFVYRRNRWQLVDHGLTSGNINALGSHAGQLYVDINDNGIFAYYQGQWQKVKTMPEKNSTVNTWLVEGNLIKVTSQSSPIWLSVQGQLPVITGFDTPITVIDLGDEIQLWAAWGADIRQAKLPKQTTFVPWIIWRLWVGQGVKWWIIANPLYFILLGFVLAFILEYANYVHPFRLSLRIIYFIPLPEKYADPAALNRVWPEWAAIIRTELFRYGDVHPDDLRALPALFRRYALKRYLAEYGQHEKVEAQGASLRLLATPTVQAWQRAWAQVSRTMTSMPHLAEAAHASLEQLTALLAETLGLTNLSAPHPFQAVRAYQVEAPALRLRLPQRFPLIYLADPHPREASIQMLVDAVEVLKESGYFALVIALEPQAAAVNVSQELTQAMQRSAHVQDFIILSGADVLDLLIARDPITQLTRQILRQVDLAVVSPFVINGPVPESMFFGREAEVKQIVDAAGRADFAILGNRKIGKTSLLRRAFKRLNDSGRVQAIWLDCQAVRDSATFLATFMQESKITLPELTPLAFQQAIRAHGRKLVLFIDEAEALLAHEQAQGETLVATWRALAQAELCHFIFAGSTGLAQRLDDPQSAFFNFTQRLTLSYLDETTLGSVLSQPLEALGLLMDDRDGLLAQVYRLTSGHPNLGQYLGYELIKAANLRQERLILRADLATIEQSGAFMDYFIQTIWGEAPPLARLITLLAPADSFTFSELEAQFHAHNLPFDDEAVTTALRLLRIYAVLQQQGQRYEFIPRAFRPILHTSRDVTRQIKQVAKSVPRI